VATLSQWAAGTRPRTLPASLVPVVVGTGVALGQDGAVWWRAVLAALVALLLQIGVNYSNDYSDGVRGTDEDRVGPLRLVGSKAAEPRQVLAAALGCLFAAAVAGLALAVVTTLWLLLVGAAAILAAWFYTGGKNPYGYRALGELSVFVFFGLVAVVATVYVQTEDLPWEAWAAAVPVGLLACALLVANNLRDIPTDSASGKRTLAVVLGDRRTRRHRPRADPRPGPDRAAADRLRRAVRHRSGPLRDPRRTGISRARPGPSGSPAGPRR
jgi:1,4-dihydroxy-2-naphthoate polyprenyltransferase